MTRGRCGTGSLRFGETLGCYGLKSQSGKNSTNEKKTECRWRVNEAGGQISGSFCVVCAFIGEIDVFSTASAPATG